MAVATALYIADTRASMSVKKAAGVDSPIVKRCAFVGHLRNAANVVALITSFASIAVDYAGFSTSLGLDIF
jgi:hypothetical protein